MLREFKNDFFSKFNVEKEFKDFETVVEENKKQENYNNEDDPLPDGKLPATVAAAIFLSGVRKNKNSRCFLRIYSFFAEFNNYHFN